MEYKIPKIFKCAKCGKKKKRRKSDTNPLPKGWVFIFSEPHCRSCYEKDPMVRAFSSKHSNNIKDRLDKALEDLEEAVEKLSELKERPAQRKKKIVRRKK